MSINLATFESTVNSNTNTMKTVQEQMNKHIHHHEEVISNQIEAARLSAIDSQVKLQAVVDACRE